MASTWHSGDLVTLICSEFNDSDSDGVTVDSDEMALSMAEISNWDLPSVLARKVLKIELDRDKLIEASSYFRGLLSGSFSESRRGSIPIQWNVESFVSVLRVIFGGDVEISADNLIPLYEAALFFGVDALILQCRKWLDEVTSYRGLQPSELCLDDWIHIWKYGLDHADDFIQQLCASYLARNFMWASSFNSYSDVPYQLLCSCIEHPDLTVDSEKHLCNAILVWITANAEKSEYWSSSFVCQKIRVSLLPLWFASGMQRCRFFSEFADKATKSILSLARHHCTSLKHNPWEMDLSQLRIRLTKYTQKVDVSGCPQIMPDLLLLSVFSSSNAESVLSKIIKKSSINRGSTGTGDFQISQAVGQVLIFEEVQELDISNCPSLSLESVYDCLCKSFPSLQTLKACYFLNFKTKKLSQLVQKFPLLNNIDLTVDVNPILPSQLSVISSASIPTPRTSATSFDIYNRHPAAPLSDVSRPLLSSITKLTLEGRTDISDADLLVLSDVCHSLNYVNMKGCISVTDGGISALILKCRMLQSVLACDTSFGSNSILALLSGTSGEVQETENQSQLTAYKLLTLHVGGCHGINGKILAELTSEAVHLRSLCLRGIQLVDDALYRFSGVSLEILDVSDTKVSCAVLSHVIRRNPDLKSLKIRGCRHLLQDKIDSKERKLHIPSFTREELYLALGESCKLEEIELGWGFSILSLEALKPAISLLRTLAVGLGGSLGHDGLKLLPTSCPLLETLILYFQVLSDSALTNITRTLPNLRYLALCYCFGSITSLSFKYRMPNLRSLKLERVTPWMTNEDLGTLAENCADLVKLSLVGCTLFDSVESQAIISSGWPGLTSLHLQECGELTAGGVKYLLDCHALEDLVLRHTGAGIPRNFVIYAASKLPMLRKISLDICDAREGDFDIPKFSDRYFLSVVKIARCKLRKCTLDFHNMEARRNPVHKETLVLTWNSEKLTTTVVKERL